MKDPDEIITAIRVHIEGSVNETVQRRKLRQRKQEPGETINDFLVALRKLAKTCNFCDDGCQKRAIRDQLIEGLTDEDTIQQLLKIYDLQLAQAIREAVALEAAKKGQENIRDAASINKTKWHKNDYKPSNKNKASQDIKEKCKNCGLSHGYSESCSAEGKSCHICKNPGHFAKYCRNNKEATPKLSSVKVSKISEGINPAPTVRMELISEDGRAKVQVLPDSGADICVIGVDVLRAMGGHENNLLSSNTVHSRAVNGTIMKPIGTLPVLFKYDGRQTEETVNVYKNVKGALMSWSASKRIGILTKCYPKSFIKKNVRQVKEIASRNPANKPYCKHEMRGADSPRVRKVRVSQLTHIRKCKQCQDRLPQHPPEPRHMKARPERPFQEIAMDLAAYGGQKFHSEQITVKAMKKLISSSWNNGKINEDKIKRSSLQTEILHADTLDCHQLRSFMATPYRILCQLTVEP